ncbi:alpha/beta hydrolase [Modestobacter excelsi]|uniref:alpha/beta hydrolase n=1 Tax=Modestobacter excelsi TaxID=2213161 RepID=UPI001C20EC00|nr:alpha/beta hydrolase [Modestobacter excelsi]
MKSTIEFDRDGLTLVGDLFTPEGFNENGSYPAVIVQGSFSSVKELMPDTYAEKCSEQGFVALAFDYAHYGQSAGEPRQLESPAEKTEDLQAAVTYLTGLPYVQRVGMVGVCTSAANAAYLGAAEPRLGALATVAAFLPSPTIFTMMYGGGEGLTARRAQAQESRRKFEQTGEVDVVPAYSETDPSAINYGPAGSFEYYLNPARAAILAYRNETALMSLTEFLQFDPVSQAPAISVPTIVVHSTSRPSPTRPRRSTRASRARRNSCGPTGTTTTTTTPRPRSTTPWPTSAGSSAPTWPPDPSRAT